jgi:ribosomal protein S18 acetylase RimI-like enzyme
MYQLKVVESRSDWSQFIDLPWKIYKGDPHWVPPLKLAVKDLLDVKKNPFFKHAKMHPLLVFHGKECVGRALGVVDENHNQFHEEKVVFFGFFEAIHDHEVTRLLLDEIARWGRIQGMTVMRGPMNPSTNHECGLLVEGFDDSPYVMMTYNPPYYIELLEKYGMVKAKDLYSYEVSHGAHFSKVILAQAERLKKRGAVTFRPVNLKIFDQEVEKLLEVYNDAWEKNWGFVPMSPEEFRHLAQDMKMVIDPDLCLIAEVKGEIAGFALALPDVNQVFKKLSRGTLLPFGLFKLLWNLKGPGRKKTINRCRIITLGIKKAYRDYGIGPLLYTEYLKRGPESGYPTGEASWILEDNKPMNKALNHMCGEKTKTYRIYDRSL